MPGVVIDAVCRACAGERVLRIMVTSGDGRGCGFRAGGGGGRRRLSRHVFCKSNAREKPAVYASCFGALYPNGGLRTARKKGAVSRTGIPPLQGRWIYFSLAHWLLRNRPVISGTSAEPISDMPTASATERPPWTL